MSPTPPRRRTLGPMALCNAINWFATAALGFALVGMVYREQGEEVFGLFALLIAGRAFATMLDGGLATGVSRDEALAQGSEDENSRRDARGRVRAAMRGALLLALGVAGLAFLCQDLPAWLLGWDGARAQLAARATMLLGLEAAVAQATGPLAAILRGRQRFGAQATITGTQVCLCLGLAWSWIQGHGLLGVLAAMLVARVMTQCCAALWMGLSGMLPRANRAAHTPMREIARFALPLWISALALQFGMAADIPLVAAFFGDVEVGNYELGARLPTAASGLLFAIVGVSFPRFVSAQGFKRSQMAGSVLVLCTCLAVTGFGALMLHGRDLLTVWVDSTPGLAYDVLRIYSLVWILNAPVHVLCLMAIARDDHKVLSKIVLIEVCANLGLSLLLAGLGFVHGPAIASLATAAASNLILVPPLLLRRCDLPAQLFCRASLTGAVLGLAAATLGLLLSLCFAHPLARLAFGAAGSGLVLALCLDLTVRGRSQLRQSWRILRRGGYALRRRLDRQCRDEGARLAASRGPEIWTKEPEPLVTVRIATYNRGPLIAERALASACTQTYQNLEILVVGDCCDEATAAAVRGVADPRIRFVNLPERGRYPSDPRLRWMVAGAAPMNHALQIAQGSWLAPLDDDDTFTPDHVEVLLDACRSRQLEFAYGIAQMEQADGSWQNCGSWPLQDGSICHSAAFYSLRLRNFEHCGESWRLDEPGDWNLWQRFAKAEVPMGFVDQVVLQHYREAREVKPQSAIWMPEPGQSPHWCQTPAIDSSDV